MATALQTTVLRSILRNQFTAFNGAIPKAGYVFQGSDFDVWSSDIDSTAERGCPTGKKLAAVCSTLVQAGLASTDGKCIRLTAEGFEVAMASLRAEGLAQG